MLLSFSWTQDHFLPCKSIGRTFLDSPNRLTLLIEFSDNSSILNSYYNTLSSASAPACYGYYILPTYPSDLAAIQFDRSGTTHIGRFVINHSFILPGLIGVSVSCVFGWIFAAMYGFL